MSQKVYPSFYAYFKKNAYLVHRGHVPLKSEFVWLLRELLPDLVKVSVLKIYKDALRTGAIKKREYDIEYALYNSREEQKKNWKLRARNRTQYERMGLVKKGDGMEIHHIDGNVFNNKRSNLKVVGGCAHNKLHGKKCVKTKKRKPKPKQ